MQHLHRQRVGAHATGQLSRCATIVRASSTRERELPVFTKLAAAIKADAEVALYEVVAGRSAMVGVAVAAAVEGITEEGVFGALEQSQLEEYGLAATAAMALAAAAASLVRSPRFGADWLEAVVSSLTAAQRSKSSITEVPVDSAVDALVEGVFGEAFYVDEV